MGAKHRRMDALLSLPEWAAADLQSTMIKVSFGLSAVATDQSRHPGLAGIVLV